MIVVGVVLLVLALIAAIGVFAGGTAFFTLAVGSISWATNSAQVFLTGAAVMLVLLAGAQVTWIGWKRQHRQHKDVRSLRRSAEAAGISTTSTSGSGQGPATDSPGSVTGKLLPDTPSPAVGGAPNQPAQDPDGRPGQDPGGHPDPGDEIRTRPLEREHRGDTER
jgi:ABC-type nickel/cobalt efflux system permease component RcnA